MEIHARAPEPLSNKGPKGKNWQSWKREFLIFMRASGGIKKSEEEKASFLMNFIGRVGQEALENIVFDNPRDKDNMEILLNKFDKYFDPPKNEVEERYKFFSRSKKNNETIDDYINDLKEKSKTCNFGSQVDSLVRDVVVRDTKDKILQKLLMEEESLDLEKLKNMYKTYQINTEKIKEVYKEGVNENKSEKNINEMTNKNEASNIGATQNTGAPQMPRFNKSCWRCGTKHAVKNCPAWNMKCNSCGELHHFTARCQNGRGMQQNATKSYPNRNVGNHLHRPSDQVRRNNLKK